jgi:hypothetical protein
MTSALTWVGLWCGQLCRAPFWRRPLAGRHGAGKSVDSWTPVIFSEYCTAIGVHGIVCCPVEWTSRHACTSLTGALLLAGNSKCSHRGLNVVAWMELRASVKALHHLPSRTASSISFRRQGSSELAGCFVQAGHRHAGSFLNAMKAPDILLHQHMHTLLDSIAGASTL